MGLSGAPGSKRPDEAGEAAGLRASFEERGFAGPLELLPAPRRKGFLRELRRERAVPADWPKGCAVTSRAFLELARAPEVLERVRALLGPDVILWGASLVVRTPGQRHAWHADMETAAAPPGRTVTVWIGLEHVNARSGLRVVAGSHRLGVPPQEAAHRQGRPRQAAGDEEVLGWARELDSSCELAAPAVRDGDALFLDGRLWHGSRCGNRLFARTAALLQYAAPDVSVRIPEELAHLEWPLRFKEEPHPPCILVAGADRFGVNRIVEGPSPSDPRSRPGPGAAGGAPRLSSLIRPLELPLAGDPESGWRRHPIFFGSTPNVASLSCHASVLGPGRTPHAPHVHAEEELLIPLSGAAELVLPAPDKAGTEERRRIEPGSFVYYPAWRSHTISSPGPGSATYLMFRWRSAPESGKGDAPEELETTTVGYRDFAPTASDVGPTGFGARRVLEGPTRHLRRLHAHVTTMRPGAGYAEHADEHDVAILVLEGTVETLGREVGPNGVVFYAAGERHGMRNPGDSPARYLVFELHGGGAAAARGRLRRLLAELRATPPRHVPGRAWRFAKRILRRAPLLRSLHRPRSMQARRSDRTPGA